MKRIFCIVLCIIIVFGVCGCMQNQNEEVKVETLKDYAVNKYGRGFTVVNFQAAKDETYTNILTLSDGECIFNVYQSGDAEASDDYPMAVLNKKLVGDLKAKINCGYDIFANFMFANGNNMTLEYAKESAASTILADYSLLKIVVVVVVNENISECSDELFCVYNAVMAFNPKYIDFEVIQANSVSSDLEDMLNNLPAFYDSDWEKHSEVIDHLSVTDTDIGSPDELIKGSK